MKKLILLICISLLTSSLKVCYGQAMVTLNGYTFDQANEMVNAYITAPGLYSTKTRTNIWFSKASILKVDSLLHAELKVQKGNGLIDTTDGIRIYFARDLTGGNKNKNNLIIVSTRYAGVDNATQKNIHEDYFYHKDPFLSAADTKGRYDHGQKNRGTLGYEDLYPTYSCPAGASCIEDGHYIDCGKARAWINNLNTTAPSKVTSEWFELSFIDMIKEELNTTPNADGIRVYFGKRTDNADQCVLIVNTKVTSDYGAATDDFDCQQTVNARHEMVKRSPFIVHDNGEECPTNCQGVTWPIQQ
jgi:hypothetical protein